MALHAGMTRGFNKVLDHLATRKMSFASGADKFTVEAERPFFQKIVRLLRPGHARAQHNAKLANFKHQMAARLNNTPAGAMAWELDGNNGESKPLTARSVRRIISNLQSARDDNAVFGGDSARQSQPAGLRLPPPATQRPSPQNPPPQNTRARTDPPPALFQAPFRNAPRANTPSPAPQNPSARTGSPPPAALFQGPFRAVRRAKPSALAPFTIKHPLPDGAMPAHTAAHTPDAAAPGAKFYHEKQTDYPGGNPAHAINAFFGAPVVTPYGFHRHNALRLSQGAGMELQSALKVTESDSDPAAVASCIAKAGVENQVDKRAEKTHLESFQKIPAGDSPARRDLSAHYNSFPGDRLILQFARPEDNEANIITFRRNQEGRWFAIDARGAEQQAVNLGETILQNQEKCPVHIIHMEPGFTFAHPDNVNTL